MSMKFDASGLGLDAFLVAKMRDEFCLLQPSPIAAPDAGSGDAAQAAQASSKDGISIKAKIKTHAR